MKNLKALLGNAEDSPKIVKPYMQETSALLKNFNPLERYNLKENFNALASFENGEKVWTEDAFVTFFGIPDTLQLSSFFYRAACCFGYHHHKHRCLTFSALSRFLACFTKRHQNVWSDNERLLLIFHSWCDSVPQENKSILNEVHERKTAQDVGKKSLDPKNLPRMRITKFHRVCVLVLCIVDLQPGESIGYHINEISSPYYEKAEKVADSLISGINKDGTNQFLLFDDFITFLDENVFFLDHLGYLFDYIFYSHPQYAQPAQDNSLCFRNFSVLNPLLYAQLCLFIPNPSLNYKNLTCLFNANCHGYSMSAIERHVLNFYEPTILLLKGHKIPEKKRNSRQFTFENTYPRKYPNAPHPCATILGLLENHEPEEESSIVLGAYITTPWKQSHSGGFGNSDSLLFQLRSRHQVFRATGKDSNCCVFDKNLGICFGLRRNHVTNKLQLESPGVSMLIDDNLEYGFFRHAGHGTFGEGKQLTGVLFEERFLIHDLEIIGIKHSSGMKNTIKLGK
ncbi:TLDc domain-containing protein 2 [Schizosaccharomyces cryophilus OY26]|uniref:Restriction of telomere capping protein 5 n=1 Tax=Schizosaccharomyces cryophilus (strain OY26 / ATCC MYA-4695 / CBS 11777 / NBRC 106824 / NRRL Y48691) TaxID=653667 RepID=S9X103_SCHCR|nr:TLDc domain-containing protein 2 [Schizosaccharomyces cryophilus OY26]EPY50712.1 TLDc domain-containing protein 2 [Schizosaccharomyces cryophilus OY26]